MQATHLENMGKTKGQPIDSKNKGNQDASKEKKRSGKERIRIQQPLQVNARIQITISTIVI